MQRRNTSKPTRYTHYHKDGSIWGKGSMLDGKMHGLWVWFRKPTRPGDKMGSKMRSGHFLEGKQVGEWITYDKHGKVYNVTQM